MLATMTPKPRVLHWFRTDLRTHDAPALRAGLALKPEVWYPVWCWDPEYVYSHRVGVNRFNFLIESMNDLSQSLTRLNNKSKLLVIRGSPYTVLPKLFHDWKITHLVYELDTGGYAQERDKRVREIATKSKVEVIDVLGHSLYHPAEVLEKNGGKATTTITQWQKAASKLGSVPRPVAAPRELISPGDLHLNSLSREDHPVNREHDLNEKTRIGPVTCFDTLIGPKGDFAIPTLEELGYPKPTTTIRGGEKEGRTRLFAFNKEDNGNRAALFEKPKTSPGIPGPFGTSELNNEHKEHFGTDSQEDEGEFDHVSEDTQIDVTRPSTTLMSPYLKFGCVGVRECYWSWHDILVNAPKSAKKPENLLGQLEFRDMYYTAELAVGGTTFAPTSHGAARPSILMTVIKLFPDPRMINTLKQKNGWQLGWERGAEVFDEYLIDWDPASNYGNWMWLSCSAFFSQFLRVYGVATWPSKFDKTGALVRKYIPELRKFPDQYIYEPWLAPKSVQREAGCIIGIDYPAPMLDEKEEKNRNIERMRAAYQAGLYGDSPKVLSGNAVIELPNKPEEGEESKAGTKRKADKSAAVNVPCDATERDLISLFKSAGTIERVMFGQQLTMPNEDVEEEQEEQEEQEEVEGNNDRANSNSKSKSKPKTSLPPKPTPLIDTSIRSSSVSGRTAHVVFLDESSLSRALSLPSSSKNPLSWPPADTSAEPRGLGLYLKRHQLLRPALDAVSTHVDTFMQHFDFEQNAKRAAAASQYKKGVPIVDDDGFELVTRGGAYGKTVGGGVGVASKKFELAAKRGELTAGKKRKKGRDKSKDLEGLYAHEQREKKRKSFMELRERFEEDKKKVAKLKSTRRFKPY
ncbi:unnamed protein product [Rhizoctonia solani]|uniref:Photolyase/cryptochrome alpha/beta domain-containing protein n=1 Tax=Rhizoctonia solani TaxID=456999 RepID=A0A8H3GRC5_9AGAM|nr:unnamed protein product [Rhizoctonia solani]